MLLLLLLIIFWQKASAEKIDLFIIILIVVGNASAIVDPFSRCALMRRGREKGWKVWVCVWRSIALGEPPERRKRGAMGELTFATEQEKGLPRQTIYWTLFPFPKTIP